MKPELTREQITTAIAALTALLPDPPAQEWPKEWTSVYLLEADGYVQQRVYFDDDLRDEFRQGNIKRTKEEAEAERDKRARVQVLRERFGMREWRSCASGNWVLTRHQDDDWGVEISDYEALTQYYFPSKSAAQGAADWLNSEEGR